MNITKQQVFDAAWNGLKGQGFVRTDHFQGPALMPGQIWQGRCGAPATNGNLSCAAMHVNDALESSPLTIVGEPFWMGMMECHQYATSPADMERRLREFAKAHGLTVPGDAFPFPKFMERVMVPVSLAERPPASVAPVAMQLIERVAELVDASPNRVVVHDDLPRCPARAMKTSPESEGVHQIAGSSPAPLTNSI